MKAKKWLVNYTLGQIICDTRPFIPAGTVITDLQYKMLAPEARAKCVEYKKAPKAPKLYNVELRIWNKEKKVSRTHSTIMWSSPYALCKWKKKTVEQGLLKLMDTYGAASYLTDHPDNGFYYKIVRADKKK